MARVHVAWGVLIWFMTALWLLGDLGTHAKEYFILDRDAVSGAITKHYPFRMTMLESGQTNYRCLCVMQMNLMHTLFLNHSGMRTLVEALLHALVCWSLFRLLRLLSISAPASAGATLLFLSAPAAHQILFTPGVSCVTISTYLFLLMTAVYLTDRSRWRVPAMMVLCAASLLYYEIAVPVYLALPLLYAATHRGWRREQRMALLPVVCLLLVFALHVGLTASTRGPIKRGGSQSFTALDKLGDKALTVAVNAASLLQLNGLLRKAVRDGWTRMQESRWVAWCALYAVAAAMWLRWWNRVSADVANDECGSPWLVLWFGLLATLLPWLLIIAIRTPSWSSRVCYFPLLGAAVALAAAADIAGGALRSNRSISRLYWSAAGALVVALTWSGAIAMIGVQSWYQIGGYNNRTFATHVHELVPHPPGGAFLIPISLCPPQEDVGARVGQAHRDSFSPPVWGDSIEATAILGLAYRRADISCWMVPGKSLEELERFPQNLYDNNSRVFEAADAHGFEIPVIHTMHQEHETYSWKNVIPFTMDCDLNMHLIGKIHLEHPDNSDEDIRLAGVTAGGGDVALYAPRPAQTAGRALQWQWDAGAVPWLPLYDSAVRRRVAWLDPLRAAAMSTLLPPSVQPVHIYLRAFSPSATGILTCLLSGQSIAERALHRWEPITLLIAPHSVPQCLMLRASGARCAVSEPLTDGPANTR